MRVAIFHDWIDPIGGAERVVIELARHLKADIITLNLNQETIKKMECGDIKFINLKNTINIPPIKQLHASYLFSKCNFSGKYDFFIFSGCWAVFASKKHQPNLYYCHAPVRVFYDLFKNYKKHVPALMRLFFSIYRLAHRKWYENSIKYVKKIIVNSINTKSRVKKFLNRNSAIVSPPTNTSNYKNKKSEDFWISVNRIYPHKRVEIQTKAFKKLPQEKLIIVGGIVKGDNAEKYFKEVKKNSSENIKFLGRISDEKLRELYSECKGLITTSLDEDFGITPIEAMASGKPTIAPNQGGYKETIINNKTGILIDNITPEKIIQAVRCVNNELKKDPNKYKRDCIKQAKKFDTRIFIKKIKEEIKNSFQNAKP